VLAYLFVAIYLSVRQSVRELEEAAEGELGMPERFAAPGQDEFAQLAAAYSRVRGERIALREQLRLADKLATNGQLAAGTAHELNEPLAAILGFAELAQKCDGLPDQANRDLAKIARATLHAREIIRQLLLFARRTPPKKAPTDINQVVNEDLEMLEARCSLAGISIVRDLAADLPNVEADANQVRQALLNLIVNAVQASPRGGEINVSTHADGGAVLVAVEDHGCGMSEEVRKHLFLPFYSTKEVGRGTGLGLSVVHGIITAHSGTIHVNSAPDRGTRIEVRLPVFAQST
jgi:signal transduction histidine kinase